MSPRTLLAASATAAALLPGGTAIAAPATGTTTLDLRPSAAALERLGVTVTPVAPATLRAGRLRTPASQLLGTTAQHRGGLRLRRGRLRVTFAAVRLGRSTATAVVGTRRRTIATLRGPRPRVGADGLRLAGASLHLTASTRTAIGKALRLRRAVPTRLARVTSTIRPAVRTQAPSTSPGSPPGPAPSTTAPPPSTTTPPAPTAPPSAAGGPACQADGQTLPPSPSGTAIASSANTYALRPSWVGYVTGGGSGTITGSDGATGGPSSFDLEALAAGTDAMSGETTIRLRGRVRSQKPSVGIDQLVADPEIVIAADGRSARVLASGVFGRGGGPGQPSTGSQVYVRCHVLTLDLDAPAVTQAVDGAGIRTWSGVPAVIGPEGAKPLGYPVGDPYGGWTVRAPDASVTVRQRVTGTAGFAKRQSWISYVTQTPPAGTIDAEGGVTREGPGSDNRFAYATAPGAWDPATKDATVDLPGTIRYRKPGHGITDLRFADPQVVLDGAASRVVATVSSPQGTNPERLTVATIAPSSVAAAESPSVTEGAPTYSGIQFLFTSQGAAKFSSSYDGTDFGTYTLTLRAP